MAKKVILKDDNVEIMPITRGELVLDSSGQLAFHSSQFLATQSLPGLMSGEDKTKLDSLEKVTVEDKKVEQVNTTTNSSYRILFSNSADDTTKTEGARKSAKLLFNPSTGALTATALIGKLDWSNLNDVPENFTPAQHIHNTSEITALTSYSKASSASDLVTTDTLNAALGKLEYKADTAYDWIVSVTTADTDKYINKWQEIIDFLNAVDNKEGADIIDEFVTRKTGQTITGVKTFSTLLKFTVALGTAPFTVTSTTKVSNLNSDMVDGYHISTAGTTKPWGTIVTIGSDGVSEMGRYIDFHYDNTTGSDYSTRLLCGGNHSNVVTLPSATGTLALTSQIPSVTNYYWANVKVSSTSSTTTTPTFALTTATAYIATQNGQILLWGPSKEYWLGSNTTSDFYLWGSSSTAHLRIGTNNTERVRVTKDGNVGIGTTTPIHKLQVAGAGVFNNTGSTTYASNGITIGAGDAAARYITCYGKTGSSYINVGYGPGVNNSGEFFFNYVSNGSTSNYSGVGIYGGANYMYLYPDYTTFRKPLVMPGELYSGNCAINMSNSDIININALYTADNAESGTEGLQFSRGNGYYDSVWASSGTLYFSPNGNLNRAGSYSTNYTVIHSGNIGSQSVSYATSAGSVAWGNVTGKPSTFTPSTHYHNYFPENTAVYFRDPNNASWRGGMYWGSAGNEALCFVTVNANTSFRFFTGSDIANWTSSTWQGTPAFEVNKNGAYAPHFYESSDQRLKENIKAILDRDNMPQIKEFDWKESGEHSYGLIAQELEEQGYSELVSTKDDGYKTVNYSAALSLIVGKLQVKIKELEKEIEILKNKN